MDRMGHFGLLIMLAFLVGYFNFSFLWALIFIYIAYKIDNVRQVTLAFSKLYVYFPQEKLNKMRERDWRKTHQHLETTIKKPAEVFFIVNVQPHF